MLGRQFFYKRWQSVLVRIAWGVNLSFKATRMAHHGSDGSQVSRTQYPEAQVGWEEKAQVEGELQHWVRQVSLSHTHTAVQRLAPVRRNWMCHWPWSNRGADVCERNEQLSPAQRNRWEWSWELGSRVQQESWAVAPHCPAESVLGCALCLVTKVCPTSFGDSMLCSSRPVWWRAEATAHPHHCPGSAFASHGYGVLDFRTLGLCQWSSEVTS